MTKSPLDILMEGFKSVNAVSETSKMNGIGFRELLSLYREATEIHESEEDEEIRYNMTNTIEVHFGKLIYAALENDPQFASHFLGMKPDHITEIIRTFTDYETKYTYDPKIREELKARLSRII